MTRKPPFQYVNTHGQPVQVGRHPAVTPSPAELQAQARLEQATRERAQKLDAADVQTVFDALCLAG